MADRRHAPWITESPRWDLKLLDVAPKRNYIRMLHDAGMARTASVVDQVVFNHELEGQVQHRDGTHVRHSAAFHGAAGTTSKENAAILYENADRYYERQAGRRKPEDIAEWVFSSPDRTERLQRACLPPVSCRESVAPASYAMSLAVPSMSEGTQFLRERPFAPTRPRQEDRRTLEASRSASIPRPISQLDEIVFARASPRAPATDYAPQLSPRSTAARHQTGFEGAFGRTSQEENQLHFTRTSFGAGDFKGKRHVPFGQLPDLPVYSPRYGSTPQQWAGVKSQVAPSFSLHHSY